MSRDNPLQPDIDCTTRAIGRLVDALSADPAERAEIATIAAKQYAEAQIPD